MSAWDEQAAREPIGVLTRVFGGELVLLHLDRAIFFGVDGAGLAMWHELVRAPTIQRAFEALVPLFDVEPALLERHLSAFLDDLSARGLIEINAAPPFGDEGGGLAGAGRRGRGYERPEIFVYGPIRELTHASPVRSGTLKPRATRSG